MNDGSASQCDSSQQYTNSNSKSDINAQERKHANTTHEEGSYTNHRSFNKVIHAFRKKELFFHLN